ncbi:MAG: hypothetical protein AAGK78_03335 [Planctomycetota bacterium]
MMTATTLAALLLASTGVAMVAQDDEGDAERMRRIERTEIRKPFSELASLTEEQKLRIKTIRRDVLDQINALRREERRQIMELLTEEQKAELAALRRGDREDGATTRPADDDNDK